MGYNTAFQYMFPMCADQILVISISLSLSLVYVCRLLVPLFLLLRKYIKFIVSYSLPTVLCKTRNLFLLYNSHLAPVNTTFI